jgi:predicted nucleic acid-binding protein
MFIDTNVLVHASAVGAPMRQQSRSALSQIAATVPLRISRQVLREFVAVITRPQTWAHAQTVAQAASAAAMLARDFEILEDGPAVWDVLLSLCRKFEFGGKQVHDANIVATMLAHGETRLLTFNMADFERFKSLVDLRAP